MENVCIPHTQIPGSSRIFLDLLYHYERVRDLYPHQPNLDGIEAAAEAIDYPGERRERVVAALRRQNADAGPAVAANLDRLARRETVVVATGQQVGLLGGPCFAAYKALAAIKYAAELSNRGTPAVPVFWLATEDHDIDEVSHVELLDRDSRRVEIQAATDVRPGAPAGDAKVREVDFEKLRTALSGMDFSSEVQTLVEETYGGAPRFGEAFAALWRRLFAKRGLILLDPMDEELRATAAPLLQQALEAREPIAAELAERARVLQQRGYHVQVAAPADGVMLFRFEDGRRTPLRLEDAGYKAGRRAYARDELQRLLESEPESFSPNALLRPVVQDYLLPTAGLLGGPAELAYWAQSAVLYERLLGRAPAMLHRASFTLLGQRVVKLLDKYELSVTDCLTHEAELRKRLGARLTPAGLTDQLERQGAAVGRALEQMRGSLKEFDPTLAEALERSRRKIRYQFEKIRDKTGREMLRRDARASGDAECLAAWLYPHRGQQERRYSILSFQARYGERLFDEIYEAIRPECANHQALVL